MTPTEPHVSGWKPDFLPADVQLEKQAALLSALVGDHAVAAWTVWIVDRDEWFADLPIVLVMKSGRQLELCWEKFDDLSVTWDTIDLAVTPKAWVDWPLEWRRQENSPFGPIFGSPITEVAASRFLFHTEDVDHPHDVRATWLTSGLWIGTQHGGLHVFNALDENGVSGSRPTRGDAHDVRFLERGSAAWSSDNRTGPSSGRPGEDLARDDEPEYSAAAVGGAALCAGVMGLLFAVLGYGVVPLVVLAIAAPIWIAAGVRFVRLRLPVLNSPKKSKPRTVARGVRAWVEYTVYFVSP